MSWTNLVCFHCGFYLLNPCPDGSSRFPDEFAHYTNGGTVGPLCKRCWWRYER